MTCCATLAYIACVAGPSCQRRVPDIAFPRFSGPDWDADDAELRARFVREVRDVLGYMVENNVEDVVGVRLVIGAGRA